MNCFISISICLDIEIGFVNKKASPGEPWCMWVWGASTAYWSWSVFWHANICNDHEEAREILTEDEKVAEREKMQYCDHLWIYKQFMECNELIERFYVSLALSWAAMGTGERRGALSSCTCLETSLRQFSRCKRQVVICWLWRYKELL